MTHQPYDPYYDHQPQDYGFDRTISTLFVSGLPNDIKAREIHNLFRRRPGFDNCQLKYTGRGNQVVAFATFFNHQSAVSALHALNGVKFDPQTGSTLHIEIAKSNSTRKRNPGSGPYVVIDNRNRTKRNAHEASSDEGESDSDEPSRTRTDNLDSAPNESLEAAKSEDTAAADPEYVLPVDNEQKRTGSLQACSTLFLANLGPTCTEDELKEVLSLYPGFNVLKLRAKSGMPVAFADFEEIEQADKAMEELQGSVLASSDRGGMHIEYARSKMRKPKE